METSFCTFKLKLWNVEVSIVSCVIPRDFIPLSILVPEALGALFIDYFVCPWALGDVWIDFENVAFGGCGFKIEDSRDVFVAALLSTSHLTADPADAYLLFD